MHNPPAVYTPAAQLLDSVASVADVPCVLIFEGASAGIDPEARLSWHRPGGPPKLAPTRRPASAGTEPEARLSWHRTGGPPQLAPNRRPASAGTEPEVRRTWCVAIYGRWLVDLARGRGGASASARDPRRDPAKQHYADHIEHVPPRATGGGGDHRGRSGADHRGGRRPDVQEWSA